MPKTTKVEQVPKGEKEGNVVKAVTWYTISDILLRAVSLITAPIFTRLLSTSDYGIASNFTSWVSIISCVTGLGLATSVVRGKLEFKEDYKKYLSSVQLLGIISALVVLLVMLPTLDVWSNLMEIDKGLVVIMLVYLLTFPSVGYAQISYRFEYKYIENIIISVLNTLGTVGCSIGLILLFSSHPYIGRIIGTILPMFIMGIVFTVKIFYEGRTFINLKYWKYALGLSLPMIPHALSMIVLGQIDRVMILKYCGSSKAGIYSFGYSYGILLAVITNAVNSAIQPLIYDYLEEDKKEKLNQLIERVNLAISGIVVLMVTAAPEALKILGTEEYFDGRWVVFPIAVGTLYQFFYQNITCIEIYYKKTRIVAIGSVLAALINIVLNRIFIPRFGYIAAGYTTLAGYFFLMIFHFYGARVVAKKRILAGRPMIAYSILGVAAGSVFTFLYNYPVLLRYGILLFGIIVYIKINQKKLKPFYQFISEKTKSFRGKNQV